MAAQRKIGVTTPLGAEQLTIRSATIVERLGQPFEMNVELLSANENLDLDSVLGKEICVSVGLDDGSARYFHALIVGFSQEEGVRNYASYRIEAAPWLWFLGRTADCRIFQHKSAPDIIKEIFREHGFTDFKDSLTKNYRTRDYCVQYRESDLNFVQRLMEEEGIYYYFTHAENSHTLVMVDACSGHQCAAGYETIEYFPPSENVSREADHVSRWHVTRSVQSGKYVVTDYDFTKPRASLKTQYAIPRKFPKSDYEVFDYPGRYSLTSDGDHYVRTRLESLQAQHEGMRAESNARQQSCGVLFSLKGFPRKDQNKQYLVTRATHSIHAGNYESGTEAADDYTCHFDVIDAKEPYRLPLAATKPTVLGPQTATIVGPAGEEIYTDKYGRVKVQFHWDRYGERNENSSCWVRVSQIWAGKNFGWMSVPRIGQEVVVDFLEGDPDQPLITGRVYNQDNMPPFELPANKTQSGIRTRSSKGGTGEHCNEIRFEDKKGDEQIFIHAEKNQDIEVENDETHTVGHDQTIHIQHDRKERVDNNESVSVGGFSTETVEKAKAETIHLAKALTIGAAYQVSVGAGMNTTVALAQGEEVGLSKNVIVGKKFFIKAGDELEIVVGKSSLVMKSDGTILINGSQFDFSASGPVQINGKDVDIN